MDLYARVDAIYANDARAELSGTDRSFRMERSWSGRNRWQRVANPTAVKAAQTGENSGAWTPRVGAGGFMEALLETRSNVQPEQ